MANLIATSVVLVIGFALREAAVIPDLPTDTAQLIYDFVLEETNVTSGDDTGEPMSERIKGGKNAADWSIIARVHRGRQHVCAGVILDKQWVLTENNCVDKRNLDIYKIIIRPADYKRTLKEIKYSIEEIVIPKKTDRDVVLLRLKGEIPAQVKLAFVPRPNTKDDKSLSRCFLVGISKDIYQFDYLREVSLKALSDRDCPRAPRQTTDCFSSKDGSTCSVDQGSPVLCWNRKLYLRGLYSGGGQCKKIGENFQVTQLSYFADSIRKTMNDWKSDGSGTDGNNGSGNNDGGDKNGSGGGKNTGGGDENGGDKNGSGGGKNTGGGDKNGGDKNGSGGGKNTGGGDKNGGDKNGSGGGKNTGGGNKNVSGGGKNTGGSNSGSKNETDTTGNGNGDGNTTIIVIPPFGNGGGSVNSGDEECGQVPDIDNGKVILDDPGNTLVDATASVRCNKGYKSKYGIIRCLSNEQWQIPECVENGCGPVPDMEKGTVTLDNPSNTQVGATASVDCNNGFKAKTLSIKCLQDDQWEIPVCKKILCSSNPAVSNGKAVLKNAMKHAVKDSATVIKCSTGFQKKKDVIICLETGEWEQGACVKIDCGQLPDVKNGEVELVDPSDTFLDATASVRCRKGYKSKYGIITCLPTNQWEVPKCLEIDCGPLPTMKKGVVILDDQSNTKIGATASVDCNNGFKAKTLVIKCLQNGQWEIPTCKEILCSDNPVVPNGKAELENAKQRALYDSAVVLSCDSGYEKKKDYILCLKTEEWEQGACEKIECGAVPEIENGTAILSDPNDSLVGATANVSCGDGFIVKKSIIKCKVNGDWETPICTPKDCGSLPDIKKGTVTLDDPNKTVFGATASVTCIYSFKAEAESIKCLHTGQWETPLCRKIECSEIPNVPHGKGVLENVLEYGLYHAATITSCDIGYEKKKEFIFCLETEQWEQGACVKTDTVIKACDFETDYSQLCDWRSSDTNGYRWSSRYGETNTAQTGPYTDHTTGKSVGYYLYLEGNAGKYNDLARFRLGPMFGRSKYCLSFWYHMYGSDIDYMAVYIKDTKTKDTRRIYRLKGDQGTSWHNINLRIAQADVPNNFTILIEGSRGKGALCDYAIDDVILSKGALCGDCGPLPKCARGDVKLIDRSKSDVGTTATVECIKGHVPQKSTIECLDNGKWEWPVCTLADCGKVPDVDNGNVKLEVSSNEVVGSTAMVNCNYGYMPEESKLACQPNGKWQTPKCKKVFCSTKPKIRNGQISLDDYNNVAVGATATVIGCNLGYKINKKKISCLNTGDWDQTACVQIENLVWACDFEFHVEKLCEWRSEGSDRYAWTRHRHDTSTWNTGPDSDHTTGSYWGHYLLLETNPPAQKGDVAKFFVGSLDMEKNYCLSFWYHMYGTNIEYMSVFIKNFKNKKVTEIQRITGNQGNKWKQLTLNIEGRNIRSSFTVGIECERGSGLKSDYAIDDVVVTKGLCKA